MTFLFTDIEGSTPLWEHQPELMAEALQIHNTALRQAIQANGGIIFKFIGDEYQAAFPTATQALMAAIDAQSGLISAVWNTIGPLKVRMGLHTGEAHLDPQGDEYAVSHTKNRAGRIRSAANGGQILLSQETTDLVRRSLPVGVTLKDLGEHRLKGMENLERLYQVCAPGFPQEFPPLATQITHPHNLPRQMTSFIGREKEIAALAELLSKHRLVTLTGSGGVGKTRLALATAEKLLSTYPDGVWLVELAPVTDPQMVAQAAAVALGLKSMSSQPIGEILLDYLIPRQALLVLDNCEHLIAACAALAHSLLQACPGLKILASSREALGVGGEMPFHVPSLALPEPDRLPDMTDYERYEGVHLFAERARVARPDFQVKADNAAAVVQVCQRLDGIPLAIELAAARSNVLTVSQLASRLDDAFRLLTGGARTALPRQQTLRATIDWSYRLLSDSEKMLLHRLAVFVGAFDLTAVEAVCSFDEAEKSESLDVLSSLVSKSMLDIEHLPGLEMRYRMLETVRQYAREKLQDAGESRHLHDRHAAHFLGMAQEFDAMIHSPQAAAWLRRINAEFSNIRAALEWDLNGPSPESGIRAVLALHHYWTTGGILGEGGQLLETALSRMDTAHPSPLLADLYFQLGRNENFQDYRERAFQHARLSRAMYQELDDRLGYSRATDLLAVVIRRGMDMMIATNVETVKAYFTESVAILRELGAKKDLAFTLWHWGESELYSRDRLETARTLLEESEHLYREMGCYFHAAVQCDLGTIYWRLGQLQQARSLYKQGTAVIREVGDQWGLLSCTYGMGIIELAEAKDKPSLLLAEELLLESLEAGSKFGKTHQSFILTALGRAASRLQEYPLALVRLRKALGYFEGAELTPWSATQEWIIPCFVELAEVQANLGQADQSARLLGALQTLCATTEHLWDEISPADLERVTALVRSRMDEAAFQASLAEGQAMSLVQAVQYALEESADLVRRE